MALDKFVKLCAFLPLGSVSMLATAVTARNILLLLTSCGLENRAGVIHYAPHEVNVRVLPGPAWPDMTWTAPASQC